MKALPRISKLLSLLLLLALPASPALAQRRVIAPPGAKPAEPAPAAAEPKAAPQPEAKPEPKREEPPPAAAAVPAAPEKASEPASRPVVVKPAETKPAESGPAKLLVPKDESPAPAPSATKAATLAPTVDEAVYRKRLDKAFVALHVRPARPQPKQLVTLVFEVARALPTLDPVYGDRKPEENAILFATVSSSAKGVAPARYRLHALKDAGAYGMHFTPPAAGDYKVELLQRLPNAEIGDVAIAASFDLGVGKAGPAGGDEEAPVKAARGRGALKAISDGSERAEGPAAVMRPFGEKWLELLTALDEGADARRLEPLAKELLDLSEKLHGQVPLSLAVAGKEFDALAGELKAALAELPAAAAAPAKLKEAATRIEAEQCGRCHVKFRYRVTDDLRRWPEIPLAAPRN